MCMSFGLSYKHLQLLKGILLFKTENSVIIYLPSCSAEKKNIYSKSNARKLIRFSATLGFWFDAHLKKVMLQSSVWNLWMLPENLIAMETIWLSMNMSNQWSKSTDFSLELHEFLRISKFGLNYSVCGVLFSLIIFYLFVYFCCFFPPGKILISLRHFLLLIGLHAFWKYLNFRHGFKAWNALKNKHRFLKVLDLNFNIKLGYLQNGTVLLSKQNAKKQQ